MSKNKGIIGLGLIVAIVLGVAVVGGGAYYLGLNKSEYKKNVENPIVENQEEDNKQSEEDKKPVLINKNDLISDEVLGISFKINNGAVAQKGEARCCPNVWTIKDNSGDQDTIEQYIVGTMDDPKLWKVVTNMGTQKFGVNTYNVYKRNDGMFVFTIIKNDKAFMIDSFSNPAKFVDLSSLTINSVTTKNTVPITGEYGDDINGRHIGAIQSIDLKNNLVIDYVQWISPCSLSFKVASCENGYQVVNDNKKLRSFLISDSVLIKLQTYSHKDDGNFNWNEVVSLPIFKSALNSNILYWITLKDSKVVEITEQYQP